MTEIITHSFEAGRRGKPDELDAGIAHLIGAYLLEKDKNARFDLRCTGTYTDHPIVNVSGEVSDFVLDDKTYPKIKEIASDHYNKITKSDEDIEVNIRFKPQSFDLARNGFAGDSGNPIAVAYKNTPNFLPWERFLAVEIRDILDYSYLNDGKLREDISSITKVKDLSGLRSDGKISVDAKYGHRNGKLYEIDAVTIAVEHNGNYKELRNNVQEIIISVLEFYSRSYKVDFGRPLITINGNGPWKQGGWRVDEGSREAKPYRDAFSSYGVCEDSFSGEDPTKPSATGTFLARNIAVTVVANNLADFARVNLRYIIGREDVGLNIVTLGRKRLTQQELEELFTSSSITSAYKQDFGLRIKDAIGLFSLKDPELYRRIVKDSDFFHNKKLPWNKPIIL